MKIWQNIYFSNIYRKSSEEDDSSASDEDTDPEVTFSPKSAASILSAGVGGISVLKTSQNAKFMNGNR